MHNVLPVIVAIAGHVDHGKTALVEVLTGCNTDRLPQEKERGLSIDIGFALCSIGDNNNIGIVDLPGHEDYIKNMTAGAASADILLLVVAANESVMPQTREHLEIVSQLTNARVLLVITKIDLVEKEYLEVVKDDAVELLSEYGFSAEQVHYTSVKSMDGLTALRAGLALFANNIIARLDKRDFRVFVERTFHAKGHGIVVTGIPVSGHISIGDILNINDSAVRVRTVEMYGEKVGAAGCGGCLAINFDYSDSGIYRSVSRGDVLSHESYSASSDYVVRINNISKDFCFKRVTKCRLHAGTNSCNVSVKLYGGSLLEGGQWGYAHLKLESPSVMVAGDRFLLRASKPFGNIGGGVVLSMDGGYRISGKDKFRAVLFDSASAAIKENDLILSELLSGGRYVVNRSDLEKIGHIHGAELQEEITRLVDAKELLMICKDTWLIAAKSEVLAKHFEKSLLNYHSENKYRLGMEVDFVATVLDIPLDSVYRALNILSKHIPICIKDGIVASQDFEPELKENALSMYRAITRSIDAEPSLWLALGEVKAQCCVSDKEAQDVVRILISQGFLVVVSGKYLLATEELLRLKELMNSAFMSVDILGIPAWRKLSGLSRNHAVAVLEYFDSLNLTIRVEDGRKKKR